LVWVLAVTMLIFRNPAALSGPAAAEYIFPPVCIGTALSLPGIGMLKAGRKGSGGGED
jgi:hypothetical protein